METSEIPKLDDVTFDIGSIGMHQSIQALVTASAAAAVQLHQFGITMLREVQFLPARLREQQRQIHWLIHPHIRPMARKKLRRACCAKRDIDILATWRLRMHETRLNGMQHSAAYWIASTRESFSEE